MWLSRIASLPEIRAKTWGGCLAVGGWSTSLSSKFALLYGSTLWRGWLSITLIVWTSLSSKLLYFRSRWRGWLIQDRGGRCRRRWWPEPCWKPASKRGRVGYWSTRILSQLEKNKLFRMRNAFEHEIDPSQTKKDGEGMENMINLWILTSFHSVESTPSFSLYKLIDGCLDLHHSNRVQILKYPLSLQNERKWGDLRGRYWTNLCFKELFLQNADTSQEDAAFMGALTPHNFYPKISANDHNCLASFLRWCFRGRETAASLVAHC